jgi:hypothetical protein
MTFSSGGSGQRQNTAGYESSAGWPDKTEDTFSLPLRNGPQSPKKIILVQPIGLDHQVYSLLNASIGSMFEAFHAGYRPDATHTTMPIIIPYGI